MKNWISGLGCAIIVIAAFYGTYFITAENRLPHPQTRAPHPPLTYSFAE